MKVLQGRGVVENTQSISSYPLYICVDIRKNIFLKGRNVRVYGEICDKPTVKGT